MHPRERALLNEDFEAFLRLAFRTLTGKRLGHDRYLEHVSHEIELFAKGKVQRLLINLPPRHLKTLTASMCGTAWILGRAPATRVMVVTNGERLAKQIMRDIRTLMRAKWYKACFPTRLAKGHEAVMHFGTTARGAVYAAPIGGALTGFGADVIIIDDLHHIDDARYPERMADDIEILDTVVASRFDDPSQGRMMVVGHRIDLNDVSGHLLSQGEWRHVVLPLVAPRDQVYETDRGPWYRRDGELLRPKAWDSGKVDERKKRTRVPDFETLYQQNPTHGLRPITPDCFPITKYTANQAPLVMSIDPGQAGGPSNSFSVAQIWSPAATNHVLVEQWRQQCSFSELQKECQRMIRRYRPSTIIIEMTGQGPSLASKIRPEAWMRIVRINPLESKAERLARHIDLVCSGQIHLAIEAEAADYVNEFVSFPQCDYTDQIDATMQYLDFITQRPHLTAPPARALGQVALRSTWFPSPPSPATSLGVVAGRSTPFWPSPQAAAAALARMSRRRR